MFYHGIRDHNIDSDNSKKGPNNSQARIRDMITPRESYNDAVRKRIDALLDSSVDLDQIAVLESQIFPDSEEITVGCSMLLLKIENYAMQNAKKIQEAWELILTMQ